MILYVSVTVASHIWNDAVSAPCSDCTRIISLECRHAGPVLEILEGGGKRSKDEEGPAMADRLGLDVVGKVRMNDNTYTVHTLDS